MEQPYRFTSIRLLKTKYFKVNVLFVVLFEKGSSKELEIFML